MNRTRLQWGVLVLACLGMVVPAPLVRAAVGGQGLAATDVRLRPGGVLWGQVVDANGKPRPATSVTLRQAGREVAGTTTDAGGYFLAEGLRGGTYEIVANHSRGIYRTWTPETAPPSARTAALLVDGGEGIRGQTGPIAYWLGNPWVLAGIAAIAVAVPVAIHNQRAGRVASP